MIFHRLTVQLGLALLMTSPVAALVQPAAAQPPPPKPAKTGVLVMAKDGTRGSVVYEDAFDAVYKAALQVAETQGEVAAADSAGGTIQASVRPFRPDGSRLSLSVALSKLLDGRTQVQVTPEDPGPGTPAVGPSKKATRSYVEALTANLAGKPLPAKPVRVYIFTAPTEPGLDGRKDAIADLEHCLAPLPIDMVPEAAKDMAKVWIEVMSRKRGEGVTVRLTVPGTDYTTEWARDSPRDTGLAREIKLLFEPWLSANAGFLLTGQATPPVPAGRCGASQPAPDTPTTSTTPQKVRLYLGPAPATHGILDVNRGYDASYKDLCNACKDDRGFGSVLTLVADRDTADLILQITYRNDPIDMGKAALRAKLVAAGLDLDLTLYGRKGVAPTHTGNYLWTEQAHSLLRQTVEWIKANGAELEKARATRVSKAPKP